MQSNQEKTKYYTTSLTIQQTQVLNRSTLKSKPFGLNLEVY